MKKYQIPLGNTARVAITLVAISSAFLMAGCTSLPSAQESLASIKGSFNERGIAKLDRLDQTEIQRLCSESNQSGKALDKKLADKLQAALYEKIPYPKGRGRAYCAEWSRHAIHRCRWRAQRCELLRLPPNQPYRDQLRQPRPFAPEIRRDSSSQGCKFS
jgi:hypothetical protein